MKRRSTYQPAPKLPYEPIPEWLFVVVMVVIACTIATLFVAAVKATW